MSEVNPDHAVTQEVRDQWHKLCAILVWRLGGSVTITSDEIERMVKERPQGNCLVVEPIDRALNLNLVSDEEGERLARRERTRTKR